MFIRNNLFYCTGGFGSKATQKKKKMLLRNAKILPENKKGKKNMIDPRTHLSIAPSSIAKHSR